MRAEVYYAVYAGTIAAKIAAMLLIDGWGVWGP